MKLSDVMTYGARTVGAGDTVRHVAEIMAELDVGSLPVCDDGALVGMITDRDIVVRVMAKGLGDGALVREAMSDKVDCCFEDEDLRHVAARMAQAQVRRLPVVDRDNRLLGVVALGDLARLDKPRQAGATLSEISEPTLKM